MQNQSTGSGREGASRDEIEIVESAIIDVLLTDETGGVWTRSDLECEIGGSAVFFADAMSGLSRAGVIDLTDQLVTVSRAARRMDALQV